MTEEQKVPYCIKRDCDCIGAMCGIEHDNRCRCTNKHYSNTLVNKDWHVVDDRP